MFDDFASFAVQSPVFTAMLAAAILDLLAISTDVHCLTIADLASLDRC